MAFIISICIIIVINLVYGYLKNMDLGKIIKIWENKETFAVNDDNNLINNVIEENWKIMIPKIGLETSIIEGVSIDILKNHVGHFENSGISSGNICLKAYSSGNNVNYFKDIKNLRNGDEIIYKKNNDISIFIVNFSGVINYNDLSFLSENTEDMITLITNIEKETSYLRCVQAVKENL